MALHANDEDIPRRKRVQQGATGENQYVAYDAGAVENKLGL